VPLDDDDRTRRHEWMFPYILDWHTCGEDVRRFRALTTLFRWFDDGVERTYLWRQIDVFYGAGWQPWSDQHRDNVLDLLYADVQVDVAIDPSRFGRFLMLLRDGNLSLGRGRPRDSDHVITRHRPGYGWLLGHWKRQFEFDPLPWPFWMFPVFKY